MSVSDQANLLSRGSLVRYTPTAGKSFAWGQVGVGSFDDTSDWDDVALRGVKAERASGGR